jgi:hypothetical protein
VASSSICCASSGVGWIQSLSGPSSRTSREVLEQARLRNRQEKAAAIVGRFGLM